MGPTISGSRQIDRRERYERKYRCATRGEDYMYGSDTISIFHNCSRSRHVITSSDLLGRHGAARAARSRRSCRMKVPTQASTRPSLMPPAAATAASLRLHTHLAATCRRPWPFGPRSSCAARRPSSRSPPHRQRPHAACHGRHGYRLQHPPQLEHALLQLRQHDATVQPHAWRRGGRQAA